MNSFNNIKTLYKLLGGFGFVALILLVMAVIGTISMQNIGYTAATTFSTQSLQIGNLGSADTKLYQLRGDIYKYILIPDQRAATLSAMSADKIGVDQALQNYRLSDLSSDEKDTLAVFDSAWVAYQQDMVDIQKWVETGQQNLAVQSLIDGNAHISRQTMDTAFTKMIMIAQKDAAVQSNQATVSIQNNIYIFLAMTIIGILFAIGLGLLITYSINKPLIIVTRSAQQIADQDLKNIVVEMKALAGKDLTRHLTIFAKKLNIQRNDELGQLARSFDTMVERINEAGQAFQEMAQSMHQSMTDVAESADALESASLHLSNTSELAGQVTSQISTTIQHVAQGINQQTESISKTAISTEQMGRAIDGVARGAQD
jgi:methyl-accepting chemotaxis protein